jgi:hypothetical protein
MRNAADPDLGSGAFFTFGSGRGKKIRIRDPDGMNNPDHISESLEAIF